MGGGANLRGPRPRASRQRGAAGGGAGTPCPARPGGFARSARGAGADRIGRAAAVLALCAAPGLILGWPPARATLGMAGGAGIAGATDPAGPDGARDAAGASAAGCLRVGEAQVELPQPAPGDTLELAHRFIDRAHFTISQDSVVFRPGKDYLLDAVGGRLVWIGPEPPPEPSLIACYRFVPLSLASEWHGPGRVVAAEAGEIPASPPGATPASEARAQRVLPAGARLEVGGSKTVSIEFGNRTDVNLTQSLDLTIRGQLAERVAVSAVLTDRNLPLQPEGTTTELADLDKVLISVTSPWGALDLGDLTVAQGAIPLLAHRRELQGVRARAGPQRGATATGALGRGTGRYTVTEFYGQDGRQGPYRLVTSRPEAEALMIAGSERVWLDGRRLERGADSDYTVDYSGGQIYFTARNPITSRSEVRVEYQVRQGVFERGYYALDSAVGDSAANIAVAWVHEHDDPHSSPTLDLTRAERAILQAAGDSVTTGMGGGARLIGAGGGPYELVEADTLDAAIFVYLGRDATGAYRGSYQVTFVDVGSGEGDYRDSTLAEGDTIYVYSGRRQGDFLVGRRLYLPEQLDVIGAQGGGRVGGGLSLTGEAAVSWLDRNVLSRRDDGDNSGGALNVNGVWSLGAALGRAGKWITLHGSFRGVSQRFNAPEALDPPFYNRGWNVPASLLDGRDQRGAAGLTLRPGSGAVVMAQWEGLDSPRGFTGGRWHLRAQRSGRLRARGEAWLGRSRLHGEAGREARWEGVLGWSGRWEVEGAVESEDQRRGDGETRSGQAYEAHTLRLGSAQLLPWGRVSLVSRWRRDYQHAPQGRQAQGRTRMDQVEAEAEGERSLAHLLFARTSAWDAEGHLRNRSDLADWTASHKVGARLFAGEWRGNITTEEARALGERLIYTGPGGGHYDSTGRYVGVGDYEVFYAESDTSRLETRLDTALRLSGRPLVAVVGDSGALAGFDLSLYGRAQVRTPASARDLLASPGDIVTGDTPATHHHGTWRGELVWQGAPRAPAPRLRIEEVRSTQRGAGGFTRRSSTLAQELETRWSARPRLQLTLGLGRDREALASFQEATGADVSEDRRWRRRAGLEVTWRFADPLSARLGSRVARDDFEPGGQQREELKTWMGSAADFGRGGRVELNVERIWARGDDLPATGFMVERPGWRVGVNGSARPWDIVATSLSLRVDRREGRRTVVTGTMEARAFF